MITVNKFFAYNGYRKKVLVSCSSHSHDPDCCNFVKINVRPKQALEITYDEPLQERKVKRH